MLTSKVSEIEPDRKVLTMDSDKYILHVLQARAKNTAKMHSLVQEHGDLLPTLVEFEVGDISGVMAATDLLLETGARFVQTLLEPREANAPAKVFLDPADVPAFRTALAFMQLTTEGNPGPTQYLSAQELADVVLALSFCNALAALEAITAVVEIPESADLTYSEVMRLLTTFTRVHADAAMVEKVERVIPWHAKSSHADVIAFWDSPQSCDFCVVQTLYTQASTPLARFLWWTMTVLKCDGTSCKQPDAGATTPAAGIPVVLGPADFRALLKEMMARVHGLQLCACRAEFAQRMYDELDRAHKESFNKLDSERARLQSVADASVDECNRLQSEVNASDSRLQSRLHEERTRLQSSMNKQRAHLREQLDSLCVDMRAIEQKAQSCKSTSFARGDSLSLNLFAYSCE